jgi:formylmethanofuran dehydrogenase subunit E
MNLNIPPALRADYDAALIMHGHRCPAMPLGLRLGHLARRLLGVDKALDIQLLARLEIDRFHFATCLADGVQVATGCTTGKGNLELLGWGKLGLTLLDRRGHRAVRVAPRGAVILGAKDEGPLARYQFTGTPASEVPPDIMAQMIQMIFDLPDEQLFYAGGIEEGVAAPVRGCGLGQCGDFKGILCDRCGDVVVERYARLRGEQRLCIACAGYDRS